MEMEEQRRQADEQAAKEKRLKESEQERYEKRKQEAREFAERMKAGLLTPEESEAHEQKKAHSRAWQKEWRDKRKAAEPQKLPTPLKPLSIAKIAERVKAGLPLTAEETERHEAHKARKIAQFKKWREEQKANEPPKSPKVKKPTKKEAIADIVTRKNAGLPLTPEEQEAYAIYRETRNDKQKIWRDAEARKTSKTFTIADTQKRIRDGRPCRRRNSRTTTHGRIKRTNIGASYTKGKRLATCRKR